MRIMINMSEFPILTLSGYHTVPALSELRSFSQSALEKVQFSVYNSYGRIDFIPKVSL